MELNKIYLKFRKRKISYQRKMMIQLQKMYDSGEFLEEREIYLSIERKSKVHKNKNTH